MKFLNLNQHSENAVQILQLYMKLCGKHEVEKWELIQENLKKGSENMGLGKYLQEMLNKLDLSEENIEKIRQFIKIKGFENIFNNKFNSDEAIIGIIMTVLKEVLVFCGIPEKLPAQKFADLQSEKVKLDKAITVIKEFATKMNIQI